MAVRREDEQAHATRHLTDQTTSRDLFGVCRGRCAQCDRCGKYLKLTADYTVSVEDQAAGRRKHPDNDPAITRCSRCGCPAKAHEAVEHEQERQAGNEAFAAGRYDEAVARYSRALALPLAATDASLWSNRAAAYLGKGWAQQALHDAERALALRSDWPKAWGRKGAALLQLGQPAAAAAAYERGLALSCGTGCSGSSGSAALWEGLRRARQEEAARQRQLGGQQHQQQGQLYSAASAAQQQAQHQPAKQQQRSDQGRTAAAVHSPVGPAAAAGLQAGFGGTRTAAPGRAQAPAASGSPGSGGPGSGAHRSSGACRQSPPGAAIPPCSTSWPLPEPLHEAWRQLKQQASEAQAAVAELQRSRRWFEVALRAQQAQQGQPVLQRAPLPAVPTAGPVASSPPAGLNQHQADIAGPPAAARPCVSVVSQAAVGPAVPGSDCSGDATSISGREAVAMDRCDSSGSTVRSGSMSRSRTSSSQGIERAWSTGSSGGNEEEEAEEIYSEAPPEGLVPAAAPGTASRSCAVAGEGQEAAQKAQLGAAQPVPPAAPSSAAVGGAAMSASCPEGPASDSDGSGGSEGACPAASRRPDAARTAKSRRSRSSSSGSESDSSASADSGSDSDGDSDSSCSIKSSTRSGANSRAGSSATAASWMAAVEAARRQLAAAGQRVAPPAKAGRRPAQAAKAGGSVASSGGGSLGLGRLRGLCAAAEAAALATDAAGTPHAACKRCGAGACPRFKPAAGLTEAAAAAALVALLDRQQQTQHGPGRGPAARGGSPPFDPSSCCAVCGCHSAEHETAREAAAREARQRRQQQRQQRQAAAGSTRGGAHTGSSAAAASARSAARTSSSGGEGMAAPEPECDRQRRVAAAAQRRAAAAAAGEMLQESDVDVLAQQRRTACTACTACPGFRLLFRASDAHDPEVMFFCARCGCRADQHAVDASWQAAEATWRAAEAAAAQRRAWAGGAGGAAATAAAAAAAARQEEAEACAVLGLPPGADARSVARAYKSLALRLHPDKQAGAPEAEAAAAQDRFVRMAAAYRLLSAAGRG